jgi:hypothetical protein
LRFVVFKYLDFVGAQISDVLSLFICDNGVDLHEVGRDLYDVDVCQLFHRRRRFLGW